MYEVLTNPIEQEGQRVLTTAQLAEYYETDSKVISKNFNRNRDRFIEGKHFYRLTGDALKEFRANRQIDELPSNINTLYLWTERGALLHAKSLNTDKAWEVHDFLTDTYFRVQELKTSYTDTLLKMYQEQNQRYNELLTRMEKLESKQTKKKPKLLTVEEEYAEEIDIVLDFINECCMKRPTIHGTRDGITTAKLYKAFVEWCNLKGITPPVRTIFIHGVCKYFDVSYKNRKKTQRIKNGYPFYLITLRPEYIYK